jgi:hypothetical protein
MLLLECKPDEVLAWRLGRARRDCLHQNDKGRVCNRLQKSEGLLAMIDEDPGSAQPTYLGTLTLVEEGNGLRVLADAKRNHRVVIVQPRLEEWIIATAKAADVLMGNFGLSDRGNELHREITSKLPAFKRLLDTLLEKESPRLLRLRELLGDR